MPSSLAEDDDDDGGGDALLSVHSTATMVLVLVIIKSALLFKSISPAFATKEVPLCLLLVLVQLFSVFH